MKKTIICSIIGLFSIGAITISANAITEEQQCNNDVVLAMASSSASTRTITCYKFSARATARCKGEYDPDSNTLTVHGNTYRVQDNPSYGDGTKEGEYPYKAGPYYFYL